MNVDEQAIVDRKATCALVLAACGFMVLPVIGSVLAVVVAHQARGMLRAHPDAPGADRVTAALVLGWIGVVVGGAWLLYITAIRPG